MAKKWSELTHKQRYPKGDKMFADEENDNEPTPEEVAEKEKSKDPDTTANPTELKQGPGGASPGGHSGGSAQD